MEQYLDELKKQYDIEDKLENKIFKQMEGGMYDDSFLQIFKQSFISLDLEHIKELDYKLVEKESACKDIKSDKLTNKIKKVHVIRKSISDYQFDDFKQEFYATELLKENFNIILDKYTDIKIKHKYAMMADKLSYEFITDKSIIINKLPKDKELSDTIVYDFLSAQISEKFSTEYINYILNIIHVVKKGNSVILYIYFAPHIKIMSNLYLLLSHLFKSVDVYFPLNMSITNNKSIIVCHKKVNEIKITSNKIYGIEIDGTFPDYEKKMIKFELEIFRFIKSCLEVLLYLILIKKKDELKYNIIKYKILYKIYPKMLYTKSV